MKGADIYAVDIKCKDMYKKPCEVMYHIFTNNFDEYEEDIDEVFDILQKLIKDGNEDIRIYKQTEWNEEDGIFEDGDVIFSIGEFPM